MKPREVEVGSQVLRDAVSLRSVQYYLILGAQGAQFIRATAKRFDILLSAAIETSHVGELDRFVNTVAESKSYYGQPLTVLLNNDSVYTFFKRIDGNKPQSVLEDLRSLRADDVELVHSVEKYKTHRFLVAQGIHRDYLNSIKKLMADGRLRVSGIHALGVYLFKRVVRSTSESLAVHLFDFESFCCSMIRDSLGRFIYVNHIEKQSNFSYDRVLGDIRDKYVGTGRAVQSAVHASAKPGEYKAGWQFLQLSDLFSNRLTARSDRLPGMTSSEWGRSAKWLSVALNSAKLLICTLTVVAAMFCLAAGVTFFMPSDEETTIAAYQEKYTTKLRLDHRLDSLRSLEAELHRTHSAGFRSANVISALCQARYSGLFLNRITVRQVGRDTIMVEVDGTSTRETRAFQYHRVLDSLLHPYALSISSITPNITNLRGRVDTVFNFKLSAVLDGT